MTCVDVIQTFFGFCGYNWLAHLINSPRALSAYSLTRVGGVGSIPAAGKLDSDLRKIK